MKKLLDCTLRDGGFINDWEFGHGNIVNIFERLVSSNVDIIEVGFLDDRRPFDRNRTIMPNTNAINEIFSGLNKGRAMIVAMIDFGTCSLDNLIPTDNSFIDGIRVIFKKNDMSDAIEYCKHIIEKGYQLFVQPVSVTSYSDDEMLDLIKLVNELKPYSMSIVDTYGLLHKNNLLHYFELLNKNLSREIGIGYHSHNNFQLGYANSIELLGLNHSRLITIDGSVFGMGKGAGNAPLELLAMFMNDHSDEIYDVNQILEIIDVNIMPIYRKYGWGYSMQYFLAASNDCHPSYVKHLMDKRTLSAKSINEILDRIDDEVKLSFNKSIIEQLYLDYQDFEINDKSDLEALKEVIKGQSIILVGPGKNINQESNKLVEYVRSANPCIVVSINFIPEVFTPDLVFISNSKRYIQLGTNLSRSCNLVKLIATSNVTKTRGRFDFWLNYSSLLHTKGTFPDNSLLMFIKVLMKLGVKKIALAGFDGYATDNSANYIDNELEYTFTYELAKAVNQDVSAFLTEIKNDLEIEFITSSYYNLNE